MTYPVPNNEPERLEALERLSILDTEDDEVFDQIADLARRVFGAENSAISLVSEERQWFKAFCGWDMEQTTRDLSLCAHAIVEEEILVIEDLEADLRFDDHPLLDSDVGIRFYAGAPLVVEDGLCIGTLCVADPKPRVFTDNERAVLSVLASFTSDLLEVRRRARKVDYLTSALEQVDESVLITEGTPLDEPGPRIRWVNKACSEMTGYDRDELVGKTPRVLQGPRTDREVLDEVRTALEAEEPVRAETVNYRKDGQPYVASWVIAPVRGKEGNLTHWVSVQRDVTADRLHERQLEYKALHDDLTGLLRRTAIEDRMQDALDDNDVRAGGLLYIDLDRFKRVNDSLGHDAGDQLLRAVADILRRVTWDEDEVARFGGDEFVVWVGGEETEATERVVERILDSFRKPFRLEGQDVYTEVSIGVISNIDGFDTAGEVLRKADAAMYKAKDVPGTSFVEYEPGMGVGREEQLRVDTAIHNAVQEGAFEPFFHPIIRLDDGTIHGYEVLARWRKEDGTVVSPDVFLNVAEKAGLITPIGHQVIEGACQTLHDLRTRHETNVRVALSGNFSRADFFRVGTRDFVQTMLEKYDIKPSHFTMEITERVVEGDLQTDRTGVENLREMGVRIEVDDFGTGYSSMAALLDFPVDGLKFDKRLIAMLDEKESGVSMIRSILNMVRQMNLSATAEGIETEEQLAILRDLGCPYGQGYLFTRPVPAQELSTLLAQTPWQSHWD